MGDAFTLDPSEQFIYYSMSQPSDPNKFDQLLRLPVSSLPAAGGSGEVLGGAGGFTRGEVSDMEFAADGKLYLIWPGSGQGGIAAYPPQLWRFNGPGSFTEMGGGYFTKQPRLAFSPTGDRAYLPCSESAPGWGLDNGCRGSSLLIERAGYGAGPAVNIVGSVDGFADGTPGKMANPVGLAVSRDGARIFIADQGNHRVRSAALPVPLDGGPRTARESQAGGSASQNSPTCNKGRYPVTCPSGEFWHSFEDFAIGGRGVPLRLAHTYSSNDAALDGPLGFGWSFSYGASLSVKLDGSVEVKEENGSRVGFAPAAGGGYVPAAARTLASLARNADGSWIFTRRAAVSMVFDSTGRLSGLRDRNGYTTTLGYNGAGQLSTVTDPAGRSLAFSYLAGRISAVSDASTPARSVSFAYNAAGEMAGYTDPGGGTWQFSYDASHRMLAMRDPRGGVVANRYDASGRVESQTDRAGNTMSFDYTSIADAVKVTDGRGDVTVTYYESGLPVRVIKGYGTAQQAEWQYRYDPLAAAVSTVIDPNGGIWQTTYDVAGNTTRTVDPLGRSSSATFNTFNQPLTFTDAENVTTTNTYDQNGNLLSVSRPLVGSTPARSAVTAYRYDDPAHPGDVTSIIDPKGKAWSRSYDNAGNRVSVTDPLGNKTTWMFNAVGWPTSMVNPRGNAAGAVASRHTVSYAYNSYGDVTAVTNPLGAVSSNGYDANRNLVWSRDANSNTTSFVYDAEDRRVETRRADGSVLRSEYWPDGLLKAQIDGANSRREFSYDSLERLVSVSDPLARSTLYGYDPAGNLVSKQDPAGNCAANPKLGCTTYSFDAANQMRSVDYSDPATADVTSIGYNALGQRVSMTDAAGTSTWRFDSLGRLESSSTPSGGTIRYDHDLNGNVVSIVYPNNAGTVTRGFDDAGRLASVTDWLGRTSSFEYDAASNPLLDRYGNGTSTRWSVDDAERLVGIRHDSGANTIGSFAYSRDANGQATSVSSVGVPADDHSYAYNQVNFLTAVDSNTPPTMHSYDSADNMVRLPNHVTQTFDKANQLTSVSPPIVFVGQASAADAVGWWRSLTATLPVAVEAGDQILVASTQQDTQSQVNPSDDKSGTYATVGTYVAPGGGKLVVFNKTAAGGERNITVGYPNSDTAVETKSFLVAVYRNVDVINPIGETQAAYSTSSSAGTVTVGSVNSTDPNSQLVFVQSARGLAPAGSWTPPAGMTQHPPASIGTTTNSVALADQTLPVPGPTGSRTSSYSSTPADLIGVHVVLRPTPTRFSYDSRGNRSTRTAPSGATLNYAYDQANRLSALTAGAATIGSYSYRGDGLRQTKTAGAVTTRFSWDESGGLPLLLAENSGATQTNYIYGPGGRVIEQIAAQPPVTVAAKGSAYDGGIGSSPLTATLDKPAQPKQLIIAALTAADSVSVASPSGPGWKTLQTWAQYGARISVFYKIAQGGETTVQVPFTGGTAEAKTLAVAVYRDVDTFNPIDAGPTVGQAAAKTTTGATMTMPALTTLNAGDQLVLLAGASGDAPLASLWTTPSMNQTVSASGGRSSTLIADATLVNAGSTGTRDAEYRFPFMNVLGVMIALKRAPIPVRYYHPDQLGSTRILTDNDGDITATYTYDPYGRLAASTLTGSPAVSNPIGYAGQYTDPETGLQYLRARYYDPSTGQFLTRDPAVGATRDAYGYAGRNPLKFTDPLGLYLGEGLVNKAKDTITGTIDEFRDDARQATANLAGGVLDGITLGHASGVTTALGIDDRVRWDSNATRLGGWAGTALDAPLAIGAPSAFGYALVGSATINGYQCYQQGLQPGCLVPGLVSASLGGYGGLFGSRVSSLVGLLLGDLFDLQFNNNRFSVELAAARC